MKEVMEDIYDDSQQGKLFDEFKLLKNNSNMIKSLNEQLKIALKERNTLIEQRFSRELLFGFNINHSTYPKSWLEGGNYCVALIEFMQKPYDENEEDLFIYKNEIISYTQEGNYLRYVNVNFYTCALIIECNILEDAKVILYEMIDKIKFGEEHDFRIAISNVKYGITKIKECYDESRKILEYKFLFHQKTMLTMEQLRNLDHVSFYYPLIIENKLIHSIINGDKKSINIFDELIYENKENLNLTPIATKNLIFAIIGTISRLVQELKVDACQFLGDNEDFSSLSEKWNEENILQKLRGIFVEVIQFVNNKNESSENLIAQEMLSYIYNNYSEDIMLVDLAERLSVSEKYCGILFKRTVGENYKNYLNKYRVEKAKEFIHKNTKIKVVELAKLVGFNSSNTFIRVFTKYIGMTPKKYAEKIKDISE